MVGRMAVVSDTGRRRHRNEDAFVCAPPLFAVAEQRDRLAFLRQAAKTVRPIPVVRIACAI